MFNTKALELFISHRPALLIMAYETVKKAEAFYLSLYHQDKKIYSVPNKSLILCRSRESEKAYKLCKKGTMDDYIADRPLFDAFRLRLSVKLALDSYKTEQKSVAQ